MVLPISFSPQMECVQESRSCGDMLSETHLFFLMVVGRQLGWQRNWKQSYIFGLLLQATISHHVEHFSQYEGSIPVIA